MDFLEGKTLAGDHFKANIAFEENHPSGLVLFNRDPRRGKKKPDAYAGVVLDASPNCKYAKIGDNIVFERWDWQQFDLDDEKIIARERELIIVNDEPVPGYIIFQLEDLSPEKTKLIVPHTYEKPTAKTLAGKVLASGVESVLVGENYIFQRSDDYQFHYGDGRMAFRVNRGSDLLALYEKQAVLEVI